MTQQKTMPTDYQLNVGKRIKEILKEQHLTAKWLAEQIPCNQSNIYNIIHRNDINTGLLKRISVLLEYDFFRDLSTRLDLKNIDKTGGGVVKAVKTKEYTGNLMLTMLFD